AVTRARRGRLVGEARARKCREQEVAGAVAGEDAPGAIAPVRRGGQPEQQQPGRRITEARQRAAPVLLVRERGPTLSRDLLPPGDQTRAAPAAAHLLAQRR